MKALRSRILSIALAASLLLSSGMIAAPLSAGATGAGEIPVLDPMVADGDVSNQFFAWDSGNVAVGAKVTAAGGAYTFARKDSGNNFTNATKTMAITVDLTKTPVLYYDVEASVTGDNGFSINLRADGKNAKLPMVTTAGSGKLNLLDVFPAETIQDNKIRINLFEFDMGDKAEGDTSYVTIKRLAFGPLDQTAAVPVLDFSLADGDVSNQFFAWNSGNVAVGAKVTMASGAYTFARKDSGNNFTNATQTKEILVDLTKTPVLAFDVAAAVTGSDGFSINLRADGHGNKIPVVTEAGKGTLNLRDVFPEETIQNDKIRINLFEFDMGEKAEGDTSYVTIKQLEFVSEDAAQAAKDKAEAAKVDSLIEALGTITLEKKDDVSAARAAYDALTGAQKAYVTKLDVLKAAEAVIAELIYNSQTEVDKRAAKAVDDKIASTGYVMLHKEALITECRDAYNALTETQKALVTKLDVLKAAEEKLAELKANPPAENTAKTETFLDKFDDGSFPKAVKTITPREDIDINQVFSLQREVNANIYKYKFGAEFDKSSGILFKQMTEVDAAVVYEFENGLKSLEFVASYIHASIFKSAVPGVFEISWSETLDGEYTPFTASDIKYTREKIGDDYVPGDPENEAIGNQYLAYYNIENIPAQARYIKLFFKGSDPEAEYPFNYANWQAPLGYLKVEAYKKTVDIEENKTLTDAATGIRVTGDLPKGAELVVIDKSESGVKNALAAYLQNPAVKDYQNALSMVEIRIMVGGEVYTDFEKPLIVAFPVKEQVAGAAYYAMTYDMDIDKFTPIAGEAVDGYYQMETTWTGDFVLLGNDKAAEGFGPVDPGSKEESSDNGGAPDTGRAFPAAALLVLAGAAGAVLALRKRKS